MFGVLDGMLWVIGVFVNLFLVSLCVLAAGWCMGQVFIGLAAWQDHMNGYEDDFDR